MLELVDVSDVNDNHLLILIVCIIVAKTMIIINSWIVGGLLERRHYSVTLPQKLCHAFLCFRAHHPRHHHHVPRHIYH